MRHIVVVNTNLLLEDGITRLLSVRAGLKVTSLGFTDEAALIQQLAAQQPQALVVNRESPVNLTKLLEALARSVELKHLQIFSVSAGSKMIDVYENQQALQIHSRDFFDAVAGLPFQQNP